MDQLTVTAASGMRSRLEALDLLANNISNSGTAGYKADHEFYNLYVSADSATQTALPDVERNWIDFSQGVVKETGNPLDVALSGRGFLTADSPNGAVYTRNGALRLSSSGVLETAEGYPLRADTPSGRIQARPGAAAGSLQIQKNGAVLQDGQPLGSLSLADLPDPESVQKTSGAYFRLVDSSRKPAAASGVEVLQGRLEGSNSGTAESAVRLVGVMRQFEMLQKAIVLGAEMNRKGVEEVARVNG
jgi:flagellar basal body rod protein FlgG